MESEDCVKTRPLQTQVKGKQCRITCVSTVCCLFWQTVNKHAKQRLQNTTQVQACLILAAKSRNHKRNNRLHQSADHSKGSFHSLCCFTACRFVGACLFWPLSSLIGVVRKICLKAGWRRLGFGSGRLCIPTRDPVSATPNSEVLVGSDQTRSWLTDAQCVFTLRFALGHARAGACA